MKILITAFDAFAGEKVNPSSMVLDRLPDQIEDNKIHKLQVPTVFGKSAMIIGEEIEKLRPDIVISLGQAGSRSTISIERVAINIDDASIGDNDGNMPIDKKIREDGANAYFATIPIKAIVKKLKDKNIPASVSNTAGTYVCNHIMYNDLYFAEKYKNMIAGFIHLPYLPDQVLDKNNMASMSLDMMVEGIILAIETSIEYYGKGDLKEAYGKIL